MVISEVVKRRTLRPFWWGFGVSVILTASIPVSSVLYRSSSRWEWFGGPYTYGYWLLASLVVCALSVVPILLALVVPDWRRFGFGLVLGTIIGIVLSFMLTALYFKVQTDSYMINRHECGSRNMGGNASCHNKDNREEWLERWENN